MARFRSLHPDFVRHPKLGNLTITTQHVAIRLLSQADDEGRLLGRTTALLGTLFPHGGVSVKALEFALAELIANGEIVRYEGGDGNKVIALTGWKDGRSWQYQVINKPTTSVLPAPPEGACFDIPRALLMAEKRELRSGSYSGSGSRSDYRPNGTERNGREGRRGKAAGRGGPPEAISDLIERYRSGNTDESTSAAAELRARGAM